MTAGFLTRRQVLAALTGAGVGTAVFRRALAAQAEGRRAITPEMIQQAEWISGVPLTDADRQALSNSLSRLQRDFEAMRAVPLDNGVSPALVFNPAPWETAGNRTRGQVELSEAHAPRKPESEDDLAFLPVSELAALIRHRDMTARQLTELYLNRLKKYDPALLCVVNLTEETAIRQADQADRELAAGRYRGPLHGIPWGAKDLIAYPGYPTTWGAPQYRDQMLEEKATVAQRLEEAGAILVAKLTLGALAMGDRWFGGMTRNPWNPRQGSSGSSAGSAAATAAGLVGFSLGSETLGSIITPSRLCGNSSLRPTFGRVSRHGCMSLCWSMDKIGPLCRSIEDCALVFGAIHGADGLDPAAVDRPFHWPWQGNLRSLRVGYIENERTARERTELQVLKDLGVRLVPIQLPSRLPVGALRLILITEAAASFDHLTRQGIKEGLNSWPQTFQEGQFVPAIEYLRANRLRIMLMEEMRKVFEQVDVYAGGNDLLITNLTGHPSIVLPNGFRKNGEVEVPFSITFTGRLYGESELLALGHAYQQATGWHLRRPDLSKLVPVQDG
jgi:Asp-tRNA(Asn)/Glu-tRNA(Gln) amidotransferase A subunit family amidase